MRSVWRARGSNPALSRTWRLGAILLVVFVCLGGAAAFPGPALAVANAVRTPAHYADNVIPGGDDTYASVVNLPFAMNWNGTSYTQIYINMNGNCTFGNFMIAYDPTALATVGQDMMAPFWADVDTRSGGQLSYSNVTAGSIPQVNGHNAFLVTWTSVPRYNSQTTPVNTFQLVIIDRSDTGVGNFDFEYNYNTITWDRGTTSSNNYARVGWSRKTPATGDELAGSNTSGAFLDAGANALINNSLNSGGVLGRYVWSVRNGAPPINLPPVINLVFASKNVEGNTYNAGSPGLTGYSGAADASAWDPDGSIASFTRAPVAGTFMPLGSNTVTWTATDNDAAVTIATQTIVVQDTTPPTNGIITSPTHAVGVWTQVTNATTNWTTSVDLCTGVDGVSYSWSQNAPVTPDAVKEPNSGVTVDNQGFATAVWPVDWIKAGTDPTYLRLTNAAGHFHDTYAAEIYTAVNNTRRTANFYKDYDLSNITGLATLTFWDNYPALVAGDSETVDYSLNGGATWTTLRTVVGAAAAQGWTQHLYSLPTGGTVRVRFAGSVNNTARYIDWDNIIVTGNARPTTNTQVLTDGIWYFNLRSVDIAGNWSANTSFGPFCIDTAKPTTTDNAPLTWVNSSPVPVSLTATDSSGGPIAYTKYSLNGGAVTTYTAAVPVSLVGTNTLQYWSADSVGNIESTRTTTVRIDLAAPSVPTSPSAAAVSTTSVEVRWGSSVDTMSGLAWYGVYRDGALIATSTVATYTATGLNPGQTYSWQVSAFDVAGNQSARSVTVTAAPPAYAYWLAITTQSSPVAFGSIDPGSPATIASATVVEVGGIGNASYTLSCSATDFSNVSTASVTPTMPIGLMTFTTRGWLAKPSTPFATTPVSIDAAGTGAPYTWWRDYVFDFGLTVPYNYDSTGTYQTQVTYTAVIN